MKRIPVVDQRGKPLMPCSAVKCRHLLRAGEASMARNKLGIAYLHLHWVQEPDNQPLVTGADPGSKWEGISVIGTQDTVVNVMCTARTGIDKKVERRANTRRARRHRKWRRPARFQNRLRNEQRVPPSTRARWEQKYRIIEQLTRILPITDVVIEDVKAEMRKGKKRKWNASFSPLQQGKDHFERLLLGLGVRVHKRQGWETKAIRDELGLFKCSDKKARRFASHCVDSWALASSISGATRPTDESLVFLDATSPSRRQLFEFQTKPKRPGHPDGYREPFGGTRSHGMKRGTLVRHPKHGYCLLGTARPKGGKRTPGYLGWNVRPLRGSWTTSYGVRLEDCRVLTSVAFYSVAVPQSDGKVRRGRARRSAGEPFLGPPGATPYKDTNRALKAA